MINRLFTYLILTILVPTTIFSQISEKRDSVAIYVVSHGWHTGLVIPTVQLTDSLFTKLNEYHGSRNLEIGWGDFDFYQSPDVNFQLIVKAALWPTTSTMHIVRIDTTAETYFPYSDLIKINLLP